MIKYDFVFVVLVYRNTKDLYEFFLSFSIPRSKVIVVNSFYDEDTRIEFEKIASTNNADFLNVPNKGYGAGNNRGCEYALKKYDFKFLIISNADIEINKLEVNSLSENVITAPDIITQNNKKQNPHMPYYWKWYVRFKYKMLKNESRLSVFCWIISRFVREFYLLFHKKGYVYSAHGAFVIIPKRKLEKLYPIYNERMFLFCEEEHFAMLAKSNGIRFYYDSSVVIKHKEDGSIGTSNVNVNAEERKSYIEFYKTWFGR